MRCFLSILTTAVLCGFLVMPPQPASAQTKTSPKMPAPTAPAPKPAPAPAPAPQAGQGQVIVVEPIRVFDPFFDYPYPYAYSPDYMAQNFGYVKIDVKAKDASVYIDGGFADKISKAKKYALRPGTHQIELRDSSGRDMFHQRVTVTVNHTTTLHVE